MYERTVKELNKRGVCIYGLAALAALILFTIMPAPARAQGAGKVSMNDFHFIMRNSVGIMRGQTLRVTVQPNFIFHDGSVRFADGSVKPIKASVKVYDDAGNLLSQTDEVEILPGGFHSFDFRPGDAPGRGDVNDLYIFRAPQGRIQVAFEATFRGGVSVATGDVNNPAATMYQATFELIDDESSKSVLIGMLLPAVQKVR